MPVKYDINDRLLSDEWRLSRCKFNFQHGTTAKSRACNWLLLNLKPIRSREAKLRKRQWRSFPLRWRKYSSFWLREYLEIWPRQRLINSANFLFSLSLSVRELFRKPASNTVLREMNFNPEMKRSTRLCLWPRIR